MGPSVAPDWSRLLLRPFPSSTTGQNLIRDRQGVFHVTDDVELIAYAALGSLPATPPSHPAPHIDGFVLSDACQAYEIVVQDVDETGERVRIEATVVGVVRQRDFFGFNRAKHAVIEAAILATRFHLLNLDEVRADFDRLAVPVAKTGGPVERDTFAFLRAKLEERLREGGVG